MAYQITTDCEQANRAGGDQEGPSRLEHMLEMLEHGELSERILAAVRMAAAEHVRQTQTDGSTVEAEDSIR